MQLVGAASADVDRRRARRYLLDLALEPCREPGEQLPVGDVRVVRWLEHAVPIAGVRADAELRDHAVALVEPAEIGREPRRAAPEQDQEPGRERVERACMTDPLATAERSPHARDHVVRGRSGRLVDQDRTACAHAMLARRNATISCRVSSLVKPAAPT